MNMRPEKMGWTGVAAALAVAAGVLVSGAATGHEGHAAKDMAGSGMMTGSGMMGGMTESGMSGSTMDAGSPASADPDDGAETTGLLMPILHPERGRKLFAAKGCVICHAINGVGGDHGPSLDMTTMGPMNPFEFAARMWRGAPVMIELQEEELGEQITFTGQDLADIIAFVHTKAEVRKFSVADIPHRILDVLRRTHGGNATHDHDKEGDGHEGED